MDRASGRPGPSGPAAPLSRAVNVSKLVTDHQVSVWTMFTLEADWPTWESPCSSLIFLPAGLWLEEVRAVPERLP